MMGVAGDQEDVIDLRGVLELLSFSLKGAGGLLSRVFKSESLRPNQLLDSLSSQLK